ncbi:MAG: BON domain-containing protein [Acidobacteriota bacterium]|jgi:osmotically-inducible protein OsmY|nr:BON domain-containing protein [Bryobacteraceae bacterium CoA2 C42]MCA2966270.1 BON domain-containing protein [Acidobacteriaceae bacterium]
MNKLAMALLSFGLSLGLSVGLAFTADQKEDDRLYDQIRLRLAGDPEVKGGALEVEVKDGVVTVKGIVRTDKAKAKAEKLILKMKGAKKVNNELRVSPTGSVE